VLAMRIWRWFLLEFVVWKFATTTFWALHEPWRWTGNQILFVFFLVCLGFAALFWAILWARGGNQAVQERWALVRNQTSPSPRFFGWSLIFWIAVAIALTFTFNAVQRQPVRPSTLSQKPG
jgi:hypothetical protein